MSGQHLYRKVVISKRVSGYMYRKVPFSTRIVAQAEHK